MASYTVNIRPRRQATLPRPLLETLGVSVGDSIKIEVSGKKAVLTAQKQAALDALAEIKKIFAESGISEREMLAAVDKSRKT